MAEAPPDLPPDDEAVATNDEPVAATEESVTGKPKSPRRSRKTSTKSPTRSPRGSKKTSVNNSGAIRTGSGSSSKPSATVVTAQGNPDSGNFLMRYFAQVGVMLTKNSLVNLRNWKGTLFQVISPVVIVLALYLVQSAVEPTTDIPTNPGVIPRCNSDAVFTLGEPCHTALYAVEPYSDAAICASNPNCGDTFPAFADLDNVSLAFLETRSDSIMNRVATKSSLTIGGLSGDITSNPNGQKDIVKMPSWASIRQYVLDHPNKTDVVILFSAAINDYQGVRLGGYNPWNEFGKAPPVMNSSWPILFTVYGNVSESGNNDQWGAYRMLLWHHQLLEASAIESGVEAFEYNIAFGELPGGEPIDMIKLIGPLALYLSVMFNFVLLFYQIVNEKEKKLRQGLKMVGMSEAAYWSAWFIEAVVILCVGTLISMGVGAALGLRFFSDADFAAVFLVFFTFGFAMIPLAFLLSLLIQSARVAFIVGLLVLLIGVIFQLIFTSNNGFLMYLLHWRKYIPGFVVTLLQFWPPWNFAKMVLDITTETPQFPADPTVQYFRWSNVSDTRDVIGNCTKEPTECAQLPAYETNLYFQLYFAIIMFALSWLVYRVHPKERGDPLYFVFTVSFWRSLFGLKAGIPLDSEVGGIEPDDNEDEDVLLEYKRALRNENSAVRILRLRKRFRKHACVNSADDMIAVKTLTFTIEAGEVFALLGHNGAGKSTAINILTGVFPASAGDARVFGESVSADIRAVQRMLGVCPQDNILWDELTASEHLNLFARLKNVKRSARKKEVKERLEDVLLYDVRNHQSRTYSGGMKRRLMVAVASIGDPKVIVLDEPTTGLDPVSRRHLWGAIQRLKVGRVVLLTTHSMLEADYLGDRIGMMSAGLLKVIGNALHLKKRHGAGYRVSLLATGEVTDEKVAEMKEVAESTISDAKLIAETSGQLVYELATEHTKELIKLAKYLETNPDKMGWSLSQTTLEEVFMKVAHGESND